MDGRSGRAAAADDNPGLSRSSVCGVLPAGLSLRVRGRADAASMRQSPPNAKLIRCLDGGMNHRRHLSIRIHRADPNDLDHRDHAVGQGGQPGQGLPEVWTCSHHTGTLFDTPPPLGQQRAAVHAESVAAAHHRHGAAAVRCTRTVTIAPSGVLPSRQRIRVRLP